MRRLAPLFATVLTLAWGLWFGGIVMVFLAVTSVFRTFAPDRALAGTAAAGVFRRFEGYQLVLAAVAVVASIAWRAADRSARGRKTALVALLLLAAGAALVSTFVVSRRIEALRQSRQTDTPEFRRLHGTSMMVYTAEAAVLLAAGLVLPSALNQRAGEGNPPA